VKRARTPSLKRATLFSTSGALVYGVSLVLMDIAIAHRYGTGTQAAVYQAAYIIPTVLIGMLSGGAIFGVFVPVFVRLGGQYHQPEAEMFLRSSAGLMLAVLTPLVALLMGFAPLLASWIASGFDLTGRQEVSNTLRLMLPMLIPHGLAFVYGGALVSTERVGLVNLAPLLIPATGLATYPWWGTHNGTVLIAIGYLLGALLLAGAMGLRLRLDGFQIAPAHPNSSPEWRTFFHGYAMSAMAYAALSALLLVNQAFAGSLSARDLAAFAYGAKLVLLALAFFTTIVNSVALPHFSALAGRLERAEIWPYARSFALRAFVIASLGTLLWVLLANWIVDVMYVRGEFTNADAARVVNVQRIFVLQIPFYVVGVFCWRMLNAFGQWKPLLMASLPVLILDLAVVSSLASAYNAPGIAAAHTLSIIVWALILLFTLRAQLKAAY
jgi:putative peptidoglycan lipid II flippase